MSSIMSGDKLSPQAKRYRIAQPERHFKVDSSFDPPRIAASFRPSFWHQPQGTRTRFLVVAAMTGATHTPHNMPRNSRARIGLKRMISVQFT